MSDKNYYLLELDDLVDELYRRDDEKKEIKEKIEKWLNIINYWDEEIQECAERYDSMYKMYEKYEAMIEEMYNLIKEQ